MSWRFLLGSFDERSKLLSRIAGNWQGAIALKCTQPSESSSPLPPMTSLLPTVPPAEIFYPSSDGEPAAETYVHLYAMLATLEVLRQYLAPILSNT